LTLPEFVTLENEPKISWIGFLDNPEIKNGFDNLRVIGTDSESEPISFLIKSSASKWVIKNNLSIS